MSTSTGIARWLPWEGGPSDNRPELRGLGGPATPQWAGPDRGASDLMAPIDDGPPLAEAPELPATLAELLRWAQAQERTSVGPERRVAFRFTRNLIHALLAAGYQPRLVADCLQISVESVRDRAQRGNWLAAANVQAGSRVPPSELARYERQDELATQRVGETGALFYSAQDVVRVLAGIKLPRRRSPRPTATDADAAHAGQPAPNSS